MEKVKIALLGLGNVGKGVWNILKTNKEAIIKRAGYDIEISKILVKDINKQRGIEVPKELLTTDVEEIFNDDSIRIVVEVIGGLEPAKEYILRSIRNKKHVITANKMLIATNGKEIFKEAEKQGIIVNFEASVAGGMSFEEALKEAQQKGYAEADPTSDVEGYDAVYKLAILTTLAFETNVDVEDIYVEGITKIKAKDIEYAKELGYVIKLLAIVKEVNEKLELRVHPTMIPSIHPLANVNDSFNSIFIKGNAVGDLMLYGRGAGELPTGSAVVGDIISVVRNEGVPQIDKNYNNKEVAPVESIKSQYYLRISVKEKPGVLAKITAILGENKVSILSFIQKPKKGDFVSIVLVTYDTLEGNINKSIEEIKHLEVVDKIKSVIRIENLS